MHEAAKLIAWLEQKMYALREQGHTDDRFVPNHTTLHVGQIHGGIAPNVIADRCTFHWDVRTIPQHTPEEIFALFEAHCRAREAELRALFPGFAIQTVQHHPPVPGLDTAADASVVALVKEISGNAHLQTVSYAAEAGQFAQGGYEAVICGPGDIAQAHRADEFIAIEQLEKGVEMIHRLIAWCQK